jgi:hypothetical protein
MSERRTAMDKAENSGAMAPRDPIYRDSALAIEWMWGDEKLSWMHTLLEIRCLDETAERS